MKLPNVYYDYNNDSVPVFWIRLSQVWAGIVATIGIAGNSLTIGIIIWQMTFWRKGRIRPQRSQTTIISRAKRAPLIPQEGYTLLLLNLSVCDLLYCGINLPITAYTYSYAFEEDEPSRSFCCVVTFLRYTIALMEWVSLSLITVQRCVDLRRSRKMRFFKPKPTIVLIGISWVIGTLPQLIFIFFNGGVYHYDKKTFKCDIDDPYAIIFFFALETPIPLVISFIGASILVYQIWRNVKTLKTQGMPEELINERYKSMVKSVTLILALLFLFFICVSPTAIYSTVTIVRNTPEVPLGICIFMIYWIQYGVNFLLYIARNGNFQKAFSDVFSRLRCWTNTTEKRTPKRHHLLRKSSFISNISINTTYKLTVESLRLNKSSKHKNRTKKALQERHYDRMSVSSYLSSISTNYYTHISSATQITQVSYNAVNELDTNSLTKLQR